MTQPLLAALGGPLVRLLLIVLVAWLFAKFLRLAFAHRDYHKARLGFFGFVLVALVAAAAVSLADRALDVYRHRWEDSTRFESPCPGVDAAPRRAQDHLRQLANNRQATDAAIEQQQFAFNENAEETTLTLAEVRDAERLIAELDGQRGASAERQRRFQTVRLERRRQRLDELAAERTVLEEAMTALADERDRIVIEERRQTSRPRLGDAAPAREEPPALEERPAPPTPGSLITEPEETQRMAERLRRQERGRAAETPADRDPGRAREAPQRGSSR